MSSSVVGRHVIGTKQKDKNDTNDDVEEEGQDELEEFQKEVLERSRRKITTWRDGGARRSAIIRLLVNCFASMVHSVANPSANPDHRGRYKQEDMIFKKMPDCSRQIVRAKGLLLKYENFDTREFTLYIARQRFVYNILRPLMELCEKEDSVLAVNCCSLALVLIKKVSEQTQKLMEVQKTTKKRTGIKNSSGESTDADAIRDRAESGDEDDENAGGSGGDTAMMRELARLDAENEKAAQAALQEGESAEDAYQVKLGHDQLAALLHFKEALSTEKCCAAVTNALREFWVREQEETTDDGKLGVAICLSYFRRLLAISPTTHCSPSAVAKHMSIGDKLVVFLRTALSLLPTMVADLKREYHNDWLVDLLQIIGFVMGNADPEDLFLVWKTGALMSDFTSLIAEEDEPPAVTPSPTPAAPAAVNRALPAGLQAVVSRTGATTVSKGAVAVSAELAQQYRQKAQSGGLLGQRLQQERANRMATLGNSSTLYQRHASMFRIPTQNSAATAAGGPAAGTTALIISDPFQRPGDVVPQARAKRNKKNITFGDQASAAVNVMAKQTASTPERQQACVVMASFAEALVDKVCLKSLVRRVNEDLRRDEMRVNGPIEVQFYDTLSRLLAYNRLKLEHQYNEAVFNQTFDFDSSDPLKRTDWRPNLLNVMDALDRFSFTRVTLAIERCLKDPKLYSQATYPLKLYTEMVCYLRLLLQSSIRGHHEIAIGALHLLFYAPSERLDPLVKLLNAWKPGAFPRAFLEALVDAVHQTIITLETAQKRFQPESGESQDHVLSKMRLQKRSSAGGSTKREMNMELYLLASWRFLPEEYFRRLCSNHTVRMYVRLLASTSTNRDLLNARVLSFLQRLVKCPVDTSLPPNLRPDSETAPTLGHMLFNLYTLNVINTLLSDNVISKGDKWKTLMNLLRGVVRKFGELAQRNKMLFVEALFIPPRPHDHCGLIDSVYDAHLYLTPQGDTLTAKSTLNKNSNDMEVSDQVDASGWESDVASDISDDTAVPISKRPSASRKAWSAGEDMVLSRLYAIYAGSHSVFISILNNVDWLALGITRSEDQLRRRVKELGLDKKKSTSQSPSTSSLSDSEDEKEELLPMATEPQFDEDQDPAPWETAAPEPLSGGLKRSALDEDFGSDSDVDPSVKVSQKRVLKKRRSIVEKVNSALSDDEDDLWNDNISPTAPTSKSPITEKSPAVETSRIARRTLLDSDDEE